MGETHIRLQNVCFSYSKEKDPVLRDLSFEIDGAESVGLIGANGAGKSTLLKLLVGLEEGFEGQIEIEDEPLKPSTVRNIRAKVGYVFQDSESQLFMSTVGEDVAFGPENAGLSEEEVSVRVQNALKDVHIEHLKEASVYRISGGEKKLASIATILSMQPKMILMDEPSVALDPKNRRNLIRILNELKIPKLIASHDLDFIWDTCPRTILLGRGNLIWDGPTEEIMCNRELLEQHGMELPLSLSRR